MEYYTGTQQECLDIDAIISVNCNWPVGGTTRWAVPRETIDAGVYAIPVPQGSHGLTKEQMNASISSQISTDTKFPINEGV